MRKGIKILAMVLSTIVLLLIFLPVSLTLVLNLSSVQNVVVDRASELASEYLGTHVSIDRIDIDLLSRVRVRGFYVEDYEQDTMLYVSEASAAISSINIKRDGLCFSHAEVNGGVFNLRELPNGQLNIQPVVAKLQRPDGKNEFRMYIDEIDATGVDFRYERKQHRDPVYGIDYFNMWIRDIDARLENFSVVRGEVWSDLVALSAYEQSGFTIENLATHFYVYRGVIDFENLVATTDKSEVFVPKFTINGEDWLQYKRYIDEVPMSGYVVNSRLSTDDLGYFAPAVRDWGITITDVDATFEGVVRDFEGHLDHATLGNESVAQATYHIIGMPEWQTSRYIIGLEHLHATSADIESLVGSIVKEPLPDKVIDIIRRAEWVDARATFGGRLTDFRVVGNFATQTGDLSGDVAIKRNQQERYEISGTVQTSNLDVGELVAVNKLHAVSSEVVVNGSVGSRDTGGLIAEVDATIGDVGFGNYTYSDISVAGNISGDRYYAVLNSKDPNLELDLYADLDLNVDDPSYALSLDLQRADLHALGINRRDTLSVLSANVGVDLSGRLIDEVSGEVSVANARYLYPNGELSTDRMRVEVDSRGGHKSIALNSEFLTMDYHSNSSYVEAYNYISNSLKHYVPLLYDANYVVRDDYTSQSNPNDYSVLTLCAGESINDMLDAIIGGFIMAPNTEVGLVFNSKSNNLTLRGNSEALEYSGLIMADVEWNINNNNARDSLAMRLKSGGVYLGTRMLMPEFNLVGGARENTIGVTAGFKQERAGSSAMIGLNAQFVRDEHTRQRRIHVDIAPSHFTNATQQWKLFSKGIDIEQSRISIRDLHIARPDQQLVVDGVLSRSRADSVSLELDNFDISVLSVFLERWGYSVGGVSNGYAIVKSALNNPEIEASIDLDSIDVNGIKATPQHITSNWDFEANRARVVVFDKALQDTVIRGYYQPQGNRYWARAKMQNIKLALISPFLKGIVSDIEGDADIDAQVIGRGRMATLSGGAVVDSIGVTVDYLKVRYTAPSAHVTIDNNHICADRVPVYDPEGNVGHYSMDINLEHLSNIIYDIDIDANKMLVLNTNAKDNDLFYGHVYASGTASFLGDKRGIKMDIEGTSADNSTFYMPLSGKEDVAYADFVKFTEPMQAAKDTVKFLTRRMMAYERKSNQVSTASSVMDMDITLNVLPNIEMQLVIDPTVGDIIKGKGSGQLTMRIVPKANIFEMRGDVRISEGTYLFTLQNILNKLFTVVPGSSIHWDGDPLGAMLNIDAVYSTKASLGPLIGNSVQGIDTSRAVPVDCYIKLTDELMKPTVTFDVKVPNVAPEIQTIIQSTLNDQQAIATQMFWLLAANSFSAEDTGAMGASLSATTGFELLSNQLSNWLSGENYNIVLRYRPRTEMSGDEVDFGFSKSWFNNRLIVELEGGYLSDVSAQATQRASNFVGEAFITWLIDPEGAFRLKGFTQTIDRYGENQGMQESGVGVYYNESFNTFGDLRQSVKYRFSRRDSLGRPISRREYRDMKSAQREERRRKRDNNRTVDTLSVIDADSIVYEEDIEE